MRKITIYSVRCTKIYMVFLGIIGMILKQNQGLYSYPPSLSWNKENSKGHHIEKIKPPNTKRTSKGFNYRYRGSRADCSSYGITRSSIDSYPYTPDLTPVNPCFNNHIYQSKSIAHENPLIV